MALRSEMNDGLDIALRKQRFDQRGIANIAFDQLDPIQPRDIGWITHISKRIKHGDGVGWVMLAPIMHEVRANKPGAPGNEQFSHVF